MDKNLREKLAFLLVSAFGLLNSVTAGSITQPSRFDPGSWFNSIFRFDQGTMVMLADFVTFFLVWFGFYAILAVVVKLAANRAPDNIGNTMLEVFLGDSDKGIRDESKKNWFFWLSGLAVLAMGPYLFEYIHGVQAAIVGGAAIMQIVFIGAGLIVLGLIILYGLGMGGEVFGGTVAPKFGSGAKSTGGSIKSGASQVKNKLQNSTHIQDAWNRFQRWRNP